MTTFTLPTPREFRFERCMEFLRRSPRELLHRVDGETVTKLLLVAERDIIIQLKASSSSLMVTPLNTSISEQEQFFIQDYVEKWFDLKTDLKPFYKLAKEDALLNDLVKTYYGYRIIGQPDLFESLLWAVLGQQINLPFAYTLKARFVEQFGHQVSHEGTRHYLFPTPEIVSTLGDSDLLPLQFSRQKSQYVVNIARAFVNGQISQHTVEALPFQEAKEHLMKTKGIGNWTANYALMKTFRYPNAFPLEDAGLHNAIRIRKKMKVKPTLKQVQRIFKKYQGWEAYATLYLWKSLEQKPNPTNP